MTISFCLSTFFLPFSDQTVYFGGENYRLQNMYSEWTMTRIVRCRVRDWVCCFLACSIPSETDKCRTSKPQLPIRNMVFEVKDDSEGKKSDRKLSRQNRCRRERGAKCGPTQGRTAVSMETRNNDLSWATSQDEDYIVFCFGEDGELDVVKDRKLESLEPLDSASKSLPSAKRKLHYGEVGETISNRSNHERKPNLHAPHLCLANGDIIDVEKVKKNQSKNLDVESSAEPETRGYQNEQTEDTDSFTAKSSYSKKSDGSRESFSFPVLRWEFMGSPVQMPKPEDMNVKKHKVHYARFQCCRF